MKQICDDFRAEVDYLYSVFKQLPNEIWAQETGFMRWTPWDVVAHIHLFDRVSLKSAEGREAFGQERDRLAVSFDQGKSHQTIARENLADLGASELLDAWHATAVELAEKFSDVDPSSRLPWFGPDMGARMFLTARFMETWSHAQAIFDLAEQARIHTDRVKHVAIIGIKTFGWTFVNRELEPPGPVPRIELNAPSGEVWTWNKENPADCVRGDAVAFCFVVTQVRNVADTQLEVVGPIAKKWMAVAQCFAGAPVDPPLPGARLPWHILFAK
ncbi:MAG: TIGR03084 family metal-binding protein [Hyphomonas sp.]